MRYALHKVKEERRRHTVSRRKVNSFGHTLSRNCFLKRIIEGKIEGRIEVREDEEEDVCSYWMVLRKRRRTGV
jgi:hypothetical protein